MEEETGPLRVCLYTYRFEPDIGGVETFSRDLATALAEAGCRVTLITKTRPPQEEAPHPFRVRRRPPPSELWRLLREADVLQMNVFNPLVFAIGWILRRKLVWTHCDYPTTCPLGIGWWRGRSCDFGPVRCVRHIRQEHSRLAVPKVLLHFALRVLASRLVDGNVVISAYGGRRLQLPRQTLILIGIDTSWFAPESGSRDGGPDLLFCGRHIPEKGGEVLLRAVRACHDRGRPVRVALEGDGRERERWRALARALELEDAVTFSGQVSPPRLLELMRRARAVVVPSVHDECFGLVALEAMSCGTPVIAARVGGLGELVEGAGLLFSRGNAEELAAHIIRVLDDPSLGRELRGRSRQVAQEQHDRCHMAGQYLALYRGLLGRGGVSAC
ncbi:MAG: glycosyltransferase family 4 protein [Chloroflexi bacterium]|nr:glycosyltransferase family 4 protein [Chloroflexota bacterium]